MKYPAARDDDHFVTRQRCVNLRGEGKTAGQIALKLGISRNAVIGHLWRAANGNGKTLAVNQQRAVNPLLHPGPAPTQRIPEQRDTHPPQSGRA